MARLVQNSEDFYIWYSFKVDVVFSLLKFLWNETVTFSEIVIVI